VHIDQGVSLAAYTSLELGGPAQYFAKISAREELLEALAWAQSRQLRVTVLGGGSNVIVSDGGVAGLVLQMATRGVSVDAVSGRVGAQAGERWDALVAQCVQAQLSGIECLSGIPGSVGAAPIQNIGAYGQELSHTVEAVEVLDVASLQSHWVARAACDFSYRNSRWKRAPGAEIVLALQLQLAAAAGAAANIRYAELERALAGREPTPERVRETVLELRRSKSMLLEAAASDPNRRSVGSFFLNPVVSVAEAERVVALARSRNLGEPPQYPQADGTLKLSAAWLIERAGTLKGERHGAVGISSKHTLALIHHGGGSTRALLELAELVRERVKRSFGIELEPEAVHLGF
jgi:UDP-N-acetylmuramate dehydrogenase